MLPTAAGLPRAEALADMFPACLISQLIVNQAELGPILCGFKVHHCLMFQVFPEEMLKQLQGRRNTRVMVKLNIDVILRCQIAGRGT